LLSRLARINVRGAKNLQYTDQDIDPEIGQEFKLELPIPSRHLTKEEAFFRVAILAILLFLTYIVPVPLSKVFVQLANIEFSAGNNRLGDVSYRLALAVNGKLKEAVNPCYVYNAQKQYELAISYCSKVIEIDPNITTRLHITTRLRLLLRDFGYYYEILRFTLIGVV
jgi:tetratricopeptide (TPR) repeat protein